jgi:hypothetical protein
LPPLACVLVALFAALVWQRHSQGLQVLAARDVPVAFWAWRTQAPSEAEVAEVARETKAQTLFLRAGQIHFEDKTLKRVRAVAGRLPRSVELHLVYNSTRALLAEFERLDPDKLASVISEAYAQDLSRARVDGASVAGLQLDIDAPTRLLEHYARVVRATRAMLPKGTLLSVTGLPTWMEAPSLNDLLAAVDFWIPQCYGSTIPQKLEENISISSPRAVARAVNRARTFGRPFYAGLSAYGYALLYDSRGAIISLRGDIDPARIAADANLQLVERKPFDSTQPANASSVQSIIGEWRYVYRVRGDGVIDGLVVHAGDSLVLDLPSATTLRESARAARALAGERLLGLCIFRFPGSDDPSTLPLKQIAVALNDAAPVTAVELRAEREGANKPDDSQPLKSVRLTAANSGNTSALLGHDALTIDVFVPVGSVRSVSPDGFTAIETLCGSTLKETSGGQTSLRPCAERRANVVRFSSSTWMTGARAQAFISFADASPEKLTARVQMQRDDGRAWRDEIQITISGGDER